MQHEIAPSLQEEPSIAVQRAWGDVWAATGETRERAEK